MSASTRYALNQMPVSRSPRSRLATVLAATASARARGLRLKCLPLAIAIGIGLSACIPSSPGDQSEAPKNAGVAQIASQASVATERESAARDTQVVVGGNRAAIDAIYTDTKRRQQLQTRTASGDQSNDLSHQAGRTAKKLPALVPMPTPEPSSKALPTQVAASLAVIAEDAAAKAVQAGALRNSRRKESRIVRPPADATNTPADRERYATIAQNPLKLVAAEPVSTFSIDVDTGGYANVRRFLNRGQLPPADAVRVEEMLNYFSYDYPQPQGQEQPFTVTTEVAVTPWNPDTRLVQIGIKGYDLDADRLPPANLVFLVDVSGSMRSPKKLGLLKSGLKMLARQLRAQDRISVVVYAGASGVALEPTPGNRFAVIAGALNKLRAGGSTNGAEGIKLAYAKAREGFVDGGINRVLLATDGDFNVGLSSFDDLKSMVERERNSGVSLTTLGFGSGNYNEHLMEQLANVGNGNYAYIDTAKEANKVLVQEMAGTLATIAKDVKIQVEFNPRMVAEYRLIGYENRSLRREDFNNDRVDAGEIGAGHTVTALYEIALAGEAGRRLDPLRYAQPVVSEESSNGAAEMAFLRMRYKQPGASKSTLIERPIEQPTGAEQKATPPSKRMRFAAAVAGFGQLLRGGRYLEHFDYSDVLRLAAGSRGQDSHGYRAEFMQLVKVADSLAGGRIDSVARR